MRRERLLHLSERWFRLLLRLYPVDFRDEMGPPLVEAYTDRAREVLERGSAIRLAGLWTRALVDSLRSGPGERLRPAASWRRAGNWGRDIELASRRLVRAPALTAAMLGTLIVGLGAFAVVYTIVDKILVEPMPYRDPDDLYFVFRDYRAFFNFDRGWLGGPDVAELQKAGGVIESVAGLARQVVTFSGRDGDAPIQIAVMVASPNLFELLGVPPALGRGFAPNEVGPGRPAVIVLTHGLWTRLGADPAIVGRDVRLNGQPYTVIGVMPSHFAFVRNASLGTAQPADAYIPFDIHLAEMNPNNGSYSGVIRARRGTPPQGVVAAVDAVGRTVDARDFKGRGLKLYPVGLKADLVVGVRPVLVVLALASVFLVLMLMVNLASVLLARAAEREHEFAVSRALGADGAAIVRATLVEGGLIGVAGGLAAAAAAIWGTRALLALAPLNLPRREAVAVDWQVAAVVVMVGALLGFAAATPPAAWASRASLPSLLAASAVRGGGGQGRMRRGMVVVQVALSLVLLSAGGLVFRSFERLLRADPGFRPDGLLAARVPLPSALIPETGDALALQDRIHQALAAIPGVTGVTAVDATPLSAGANQTTIRIPGAPGNTGDADRDAPLVDYIGARASYVEVMGLRLVAGRAFDQVRRAGVHEALIDEHLARQFFPTGNPLGAAIPFGNDRRLTVVGVVEQARLYDVHQDGRAQLVVRAEDWGYRSLSFVVRTEGDPARIAPDVRAAIRRIDSRLAVADVRTLTEVVADSLRERRISAVLVAGFAIGALLLAAMGLFGVVSASVTRRRHELAVRLALGADHGRVLRHVLEEGSRLVAIGVLLGIPGMYAASGLVRNVIVGISPWDPATLAAVAACLAAVALAACYLPARRVLRIEPAQSLRQ
jgi:putative ABC transport system permease protein